MTETEDYQVLFELPVEMDLEKSESSGKRCVKGYASTEAVDGQQEQVLQKGLDFTPLKEDGFINYDHQRRVIGGVKVPLIIGYPTNVEMHDRGLWTEGELLKGDPMNSEQLRVANEMWELGVALQKSGGNRRLAYSIEGGIVEKRGNKIVRSVARQVALTHKPVNSECSVEVFAKSFCCGRCHPAHPEYNPAHSCGNKHAETDGPAHLSKALETTDPGGISNPERTSPLLKENLHSSLTSVLYGDNDCGCFDRATGCFHGGIAGAMAHLTKCRGYDKNDAHQLLRSMLITANKDDGMTKFVQQAGLLKP